MSLAESPVPPQPGSRWPSVLYWTAAVLFTTFCGYFLVLHALTRSLNHDEHQFLAPAALLSREGLLPFRDFTLFHLPDSVLLYAALDRLGFGLINSAKLANTAATSCVIFLAYVVAGGAASTGGLLKRFLLATTAALLILLDPLFLYTSGKTWNHELPAFFLLLATVWHLSTLATKPRLGPLLCGLFAGIAVGTRLTYLIPAAAFPLHHLWVKSNWRERLQACAWWTAGFTAAMTPSLYCFAQAPEAFLFDNLRFPRLRILEPGNTRIVQTMAWSHKLRFLFKEVLVRSWPVTVALLGAAITTWFRGQSETKLRSKTQVFLLLLPLSLIGAFLPSRYQYQHLYLVPIVFVFAALYLIRSAPVRDITIALTSLVLLGASAFAWYEAPSGDAERKNVGCRAYANAWQMRTRDEWFSSRYKRQNAKIASQVPANARVLTLAPAAPLTAGLRIYPELATGVFGWRSAPYVSPAQRRQLHFLAPADLDTRFGHDLPVAILTGVEDDKWEEPLVSFAQQHGYFQTKLGKAAVLWKRP